jgi:hypothetical protein
VVVDTKRRISSLNAIGLLHSDTTLLNISFSDKCITKHILSFQCIRTAGCKEECNPDIDTASAFEHILLVPLFLLSNPEMILSHPLDPGFVHLVISESKLLESFVLEIDQLQRREYKSDMSSSDNSDGTF